MKADIIVYHYKYEALIKAFPSGGLGIDEQFCHIYRPDRVFLGVITKKDCNNFRPATDAELLRLRLVGY